MKAREYYQRWVESKDDPGKVLTEILMGFNREMSEMLKARKIKTTEGIVGVFLELEQKWKAFCQLVMKDAGPVFFKKDLGDAFLREFWFTEMPEVAKMVGKFEEQKNMWKTVGGKPWRR
jgi:hypothetical protein